MKGSQSNKKIHFTTHDNKYNHINNFVKVELVEHRRITRFPISCVLAHY